MKGTDEVHILIHMYLKNTVFLLDLLGLFGLYRSLDHIKEEFKDRNSYLH